MHQEVARCIDTVGSSGARALILTGEGRAFSVGQDLHDEAVAPESGRDVAELLDLYYNPLIERLMTLPMPCVCAVNGVAAGAAVAIALACDVVVAARSASLSMPFAALGLAPDAGGGWLLSRALGLPRALGLALTGEAISAEQALQWGVIWSVVDDEDLQDAASRLARAMAAKSLPALVAARRLFRESGARTLSAQLAEERRVQGGLCALPDYAEGVAAFRERRVPHFRSRSESA
jgi:2-(1,2-epoxy-1,2-dihydrophenyl)acetyl-CoA isomerase